MVGPVWHTLRCLLGPLLGGVSAFSPPSALPLSRVCRCVAPTRSRAGWPVKFMSISPTTGSSSEDCVFREKAKKLMAAGELGVALWLQEKEEASRALLKEKEEASRALLKEKQEVSHALLKAKEEASRVLLKEKQEKQEASHALLKEKEEASRVLLSALLKEKEELLKQKEEISRVKDALLKEKDMRLADRDEEIVVLKGARQAVLANRFLVEQTAVRYSMHRKETNASTTDICKVFVRKNLLSKGGLTHDTQKNVDMLLKSSTSLQGVHSRGVQEELANIYHQLCREIHDPDWVSSLPQGIYIGGCNRAMVVALGVWVIKAQALNLIQFPVMLLDSSHKLVCTIVNGKISLPRVVKIL